MAEYGVQYQNAAGQETVLKPEAPVVSEESTFTHIINHIKEHKLLYIGLVALGGWIVYKKFIKK